MIVGRRVLLALLASLICLGPLAAQNSTLPDAAPAPGGRIAERLLGGDPARRSDRALAMAPQAEPAHDRDHGDGQDDDEADHVRWLTTTAVP